MMKVTMSKARTRNVIRFAVILHVPPSEKFPLGAGRSDRNPPRLNLTPDNRVI
jgi:hypothetical protein